MKKTYYYLSSLAVSCVFLSEHAHAFDIDVVEETVQRSEFNVKRALPGDKCKALVYEDLNPGEPQYWADGTIVVIYIGNNKPVGRDELKKCYDPTEEGAEDLRFQCDMYCEYQQTIKKGHESYGVTLREDKVVTKREENNYKSEHKEVGRPCYIYMNKHRREGIIIQTGSSEEDKKSACEVKIRKVSEHELPKLSQILDAAVQLATLAESCNRALQVHGATYSTLNHELSCKTLKTNYVKTGNDMNTLMQALERADVDLIGDDTDRFLAIAMAAGLQITTQINLTKQLIGEDNLRQWLTDKVNNSKRH